MKIKTKFYLDKWVGKLILIPLNLVALILRPLFRFDHSLRNNPSRIAVCLFNGMGNIIQATPFLQSLRNNFKDAEIIFITSIDNRKLLESIGIVDKIYDLELSNFATMIRSTISVLRTIWINKINFYIDLDAYSHYSKVLTVLSCAQNRFGFYKYERNIYKGIYTNLMFFNMSVPISKTYLQMARLVGCKIIEENLYPFIITESDRMSCRRKLVSLVGNISNSYVIINPNAPDLCLERRWPLQSFIQLIQSLHIIYPEKLFLILGSSKQFNLMQKFYENLILNTKEKVYNTAGIFTLYELFALIENCELFISNDTGPLHIAFALEKKTISLFGPTSPLQYRHNQNAYGIYKNIYYSPCVPGFLIPPCLGDNQCMKQITVKEVELLCIDLLASKTLEDKIENQTMSYLKNDGATSLGVINCTN